MALILKTGFEDGSLLTGGTGNPIDVSGRNGKCFAVGSTVGSTSNGWQLRYSPASSYLTCGFAFKQDAMPGAMGNTNQVVMFMASDFLVDQVKLCFGASGTIALYRGTTQMAISSTGIVPAGAWCYIEAQLFCNDTTGTAIIKVNGVTAINLSAVDTKNSASLSDYSAFLFNSQANAVPTTIRIDDLYIETANGDPFLGDIGNAAAPTVANQSLSDYERKLVDPSNTNKSLSLRDCIKAQVTGTAAAKAALSVSDIVARDVTLSTKSPRVSEADVTYAVTFAQAKTSLADRAMAEFQAGTTFKASDRSLAYRKTS